MTNKRVSARTSGRAARRGAQATGGVPAPAQRRAAVERLQSVVKAHETQHPGAGALADAAQPVPTPRAPFPYERALQELLPQGERAALVVACLSYGPRAAAAWQQFRELTADVESYFENDRTGSKGLLPLLEANLDRNGIGIEEPLRAWLRGCVQREELRGELFESVLEECVRALQAAEVQPLLLKSAALALTLGARTPMRPGHALDLLVHPNRIADASSALQAAGLRLECGGPGAVEHPRFRHASGLAVGLHSRLFLLPQLQISGAALRQRRCVLPLDGRPMLVISPEDCLLHLCGHGLYPPGERNLRWLCEAYYLLQLAPALDWRRLVATAIQARLAAPAFVLLRWLRDTLSVPLPLGYLAQLEHASLHLDGPAIEAICASLVNSNRWRRTSIALAGDLRQMWGLMRFGVLPSATYLRWKSNTSAAISPARLHAARLYHIMRRIAAGRRLAAPPAARAG